MKPHRILLCFLCFFLVAGALHAQDSVFFQRLDIPETHCSVDQAMKTIEEQTGLSFSYNTGLFDRRRDIILRSDHNTLLEVLKAVFNDPGLSFDVIGRHLVVYRPYKTVSADPDSLRDSVYYFVISGKVFDKDTKQPLPFTSVYLVGKPIGIISNEEGEFKLKLRSSEIPETLSISSIGYKNFSSPVSVLVNSNKQYFLETDVIPIQEVIIRKISPVMLLQNANHRIRLNYPVDPAILTSFYRETVQRGNHYTMVSEAILENYKTSYLSGSPDRVKIVKGRKNENFTKNDSVMLKLKAGLNTMLMLDVVKNLPDFLSAGNLADYHYRLADIVVENGRDHYAVEFLPKKGSPEAVFYSGRIIIDINDMAYTWVEFQVDPEFLDLATERFIVRKPADMVVKALKADYKVSYRKIGSRYFLHMIQCETAFKIRNRRQLTGSVYNTRLETVVIDVDTINVNRFTNRESARPYEIFTDQVGDYDESFWGEYNFIKPDESLENALSRLKKEERGERREE
jgi:hypothetical protein